MAVAADTQILFNGLGYAADEDTTGQLLSWLDGIGQLLQVLDTLCRDGTDSSGNPAPGWSQALDINRAPTYVLPWLGQFVGVRVDTSLADALQRSQIQNEQGFARGTVAAIQAAAQPFLAGGYSVTVLERDTSPYHLTVQVPSAGLPYATYAALDAAFATYAALDGAFSSYGAIHAASSAVTAAIQAAVPAGLVVAVTFV